MPKVVQHKAQIQKTCQKPRVTKLCLSLLYLHHQARVATSLTAKMQLVLMKAAAMLVEAIPTRIAHTEAVEEVVNSSYHIKHLKLNTLYRNRLKYYPTFFTYFRFYKTLI